MKKERCRHLNFVFANQGRKLRERGGPFHGVYRFLVEDRMGARLRNGNAANVAAFSQQEFNENLSLHARAPCK